uniref:Glutaredoxin-like protein n=1 Tax=Rhizochromulina marina TaxID=1034831 RepID=A0A7S2RJP9_9STRA|mmetsp:Transcript_16864/g.49079  ORF Transcript_16864/g.49079 Transcript_16864/m.49079 type:complete len:159 (+) Transcript_16864:51-527(+)
MSGVSRVMALTVGLLAARCGAFPRSIPLHRGGVLRKGLAAAAGSVTGDIYSGGEGSPTVKLFTKADCTLCDKVKDVLQDLREEAPHSLVAVDITDGDKGEWFDKYKFDIPVLHVNDMYWAKHRLTADEARNAFNEVKLGTFAPQPGEPNAAKYEKKSK